MHRKADLSGVLADDLDRDAGGMRDAFTGIGTVGEDTLDEWEPAA